MKRKYRDRLAVLVNVGHQVEWSARRRYLMEGEIAVAIARGDLDIAQMMLTEARGRCAELLSEHPGWAHLEQVLGRLEFALHLERGLRRERD